MNSLSIPAFHISTKSFVKGSGQVYIQSRDDNSTSGTFAIEISAGFDPSIDLYPTGQFTLKVDLSDGVRGKFASTTIELINSYGKHNPTVSLTGQCKDSTRPDAQGCRYWIMIANNKGSNREGTPDIVAFAIHDRNGVRIAYGMGPLKIGDITVDPN